jgi:hypothetical protein
MAHTAPRDGQRSPAPPHSPQPAAQSTRHQHLAATRSFYHKQKPRPKKSIFQPTACRKMSTNAVKGGIAHTAQKEPFGTTVHNQHSILSRGSNNQQKKSFA